MTWRKFWNLNERFFDRLNTVGFTLTVLVLFEKVQIGWAVIFGLYGVALVGGIACACLAAICEPEKAPTEAKKKPKV